MSPFYKEIYKIIAQIPKGKVATYGQVATLAGKPHGARAVGWALRASSSDLELPWQRVVNAQGQSSFDDPVMRRLQKSLLQDERVGFRQNGSVDLENFRWKGFIGALPIPHSCKNDKLV